MIEKIKELGEKALEAVTKPFRKSSGKVTRPKAGARRAPGKATPRAAAGKKSGDKRAAGRKLPAKPGAGRKTAAKKAAMGGKKTAGKKTSAASKRGSGGKVKAKAGGARKASRR